MELVYLLNNKQRYVPQYKAVRSISISKITSYGLFSVVELSTASLLFKSYSSRSNLTLSSDDVFQMIKQLE